MRAKQRFTWDKLSLGACYYPEQWDASLWREDLRRMKAVGVGTVRVAEFSWSLIEPREGVFDFSFWDRFLDVAQGEGMKVIWGTPTATPPAWLTEKYHEVLNCRKDGVAYRHGMRRHYNYNSPKYRELCARIVEKIAERYAARSCIVGWQIDNEMNCETDEFYSEADEAAFRKFLKDRYGTLDALNAAWGTVVWSQTYSDWDEVCLPRTVVHDDSNNPHQMLDYSRFISESVISFCKMQCDIIRRYVKPGDFITTNGLFGNLDNHRMMSECLDVYTYDSYPNFPHCLDHGVGADDPLKDRAWSMKLSETRSVCPHFGIMEQQTGATGWHSRMEGPAPKPGQLSLWAMQSIAHGADYLGFFRWRTATVGAEMYWQGILDYDGRDNRRLKEVAEVARRMGRISGIAGADYAAAFALVKDYDNLWDDRYDRWHGRIASSSEAAIFEAAQFSHAPCDVLYINDETDPADLQKYPVLVYPHPMIMTRARAGLLRAYVEAGGTLLVGARAGMKDVCGHCVTEPSPGLLRDLTGTNVADWTLRSPVTDQVEMDWAGSPVSTGIFNDIIDTDDDETVVLATYASDYYKGKAALTERMVGEGRMLHFGGTFTRTNAYAFLKYLGIFEPWSEYATLPAECELAVRKRGDETYFIILNYSAKPQTITLHRRMADLDTGADACGDFVLPPYGSRVYKMI